MPSLRPQLELRFGLAWAWQHESGDNAYDDDHESGDNAYNDEHESGDNAYDDQHESGDDAYEDEHENYDFYEDGDSYCDDHVSLDKFPLRNF